MRRVNPIAPALTSGARAAQAESSSKARANMAGPTHWTDDELVDRLLRGNRRAQGEFYRRMGPVIRAKILRVTSGSQSLPSSTDDYVQQVFLALLKDDWRRLKARRGVSLAGHVSRIAGQVTVDTLRRELAEKRRPKGGFSDDDDVHDAGSVVIMDLAVFQEEGLKAQPQSVMAVHRMLGEGGREAKWVYVLLSYKF